jgi:hypothetical protein
MFCEDRIIYEMDGERLLGYIEFWRVTTEQIGRILFSPKFDVFREDLVGGPICYVANIAILPEHRGGVLLRLLKGRLFKSNQTATHFCGEANHGKAKSFKIFSKKTNRVREEVMSDVI